MASVNLLEDSHVPAFCSANRAPTRSECFRNLSVQLRTHCSLGKEAVRPNVNVACHIQSETGPEQ